MYIYTACIECMYIVIHYIVNTFVAYSQIMSIMRISVERPIPVEYLKMITRSTQAGLAVTIPMISVNYKTYNERNDTAPVAYLGFQFGGGGFKIFREKWGSRHAARGKATRLLGGFGGMLPRENF